MQNALENQQSNAVAEVKEVKERERGRETERDRKRKWGTLVAYRWNGSQASDSSPRENGRKKRSAQANEKCSRSRSWH